MIAKICFVTNLLYLSKLVTLQRDRNVTLLVLRYEDIKEKIFQNYLVNTTFILQHVNDNIMKGGLRKPGNSISCGMAFLPHYTPS